MVALLDYGAGNPTSVRKALVHLGADVMTPAEPADLDRASALVVPGVGHFQATARVGEPWRAAIRALVARGRPLLGICLGMQWLFEGSTEAPGVPGLGLVRGYCRRVEAGGLKLPHVGWNALQIVRPSWLLAGVGDAAAVYFTHSYAVPAGAGCAAVTTYGAPFSAVIELDDICGVQFHPEKSGEVGLTILSNFLARARSS